MKPQIRTNADKIGVEIMVRMPDLDGYPKTYLDANVSAGVSSGTSLDGSFLAANDYVVLGKPGVPGSEIIRVSSVTNSITINFVTNTVFEHAQGTEVTFIPFNQVRIQESTDSGSSYTTLATQDLKVNNPEHLYMRTAGLSTNYYRAYFYNSNSSLLSTASDGILGSGYADNTAYAIKQRAVRASGMEMADLYVPGAKVSDAYLNESLSEGRRVVHDAVKRHTWLQEFEYNLGNLQAGQYSIALPSNMRDSNTSKNLLSVRIGSDRDHLEPISKREWNAKQSSMAHTTVGTAMITTDTSITLTDSGDFDESGTITIIDSGTEDSIDYTANNESTNVLSGVTGITANHAAALDVWQQASFGLPRYYTVFEGRLYFDQPLATDYHNENVFIDYYKNLTAVDSDGDTLAEPDYDMYVPYLKWKIRQARDEGVVEGKDRDYQEFETRLLRLVDKEKDDQELRLVPDVPIDEEDV